MNYWHIILILFLISDGCGDKSNQEEPITRIEYSAQSRGFILEILTDPTGYTVISKSVNNDTVRNPLTKDQWQSLVKALDPVDLSAIPDIKTKTDKMAVDKAAIASITIATKSATFTSAAFDHGTPPKVLLPIVNKLLDLAKTVEGQK